MLSFLSPVPESVHLLTRSLLPDTNKQGKKVALICCAMIDALRADSDCEVVAEISGSFNQQKSFCHCTVSILTFTFADLVFRLLVQQTVRDEVAGRWFWGKRLRGCRCVGVTLLCRLPVNLFHQ
jgi:hypothetical protein